MSRLKCFDITTIKGLNSSFDKLVNNDTSEDAQKSIAMDIVLDHYKSLQDELNSLKTSIGLPEDSYTDPRAEVQNITKNYQSKIDSLQAPALPEDLEKKIDTFLEKIGVSVQALDSIKDKDGKPLSVVAKADILNKVIQVVQGKADITTLPEEAAHFFVEMLGDGSPLLREMMDKVTGYKLYPEVVSEYKNLKAYRNEDGSVNFTKIKKEAIGKLIALHLIGEENSAETHDKLNFLAHWFNKVLDWVKSVFSKETSNPFKTVSDKIKSADTSDLDSSNLEDSEFYQTVQDSVKQLDEDQTKLVLDNTVDPITKQKRHIYYYDGVKAKGSVTTYYVDPWLKKKFKTDNRSELQKTIDLLKAEHGDVIHDQVNKIVKSWTDEKGYKLNSQAAVDVVVPQHIYSKLNEYLQEVIEQYPEGTQFRSEVKIFDKKTRIAGSIDLLVILPDGSVDIYDWKSQEIFKGQTDLKSYKEPMYRIQLDNYKKILEYQYGFTKFNKVRAIPIKTDYNFSKDGFSGIKDIEIGSVDPNNIPEEKSYLLPVTLKTEKTGQRDVDELVKKLYKIYDKLEQEPFKKDTHLQKNQEMDALRQAIRDLQLRNRVDKLIELGVIQYKKYSDKIRSKTLTGKDIIEAQKVLGVFSESSILLSGLMMDLKKAAKNSDDPSIEASYEDIKNQFLSMTANVGLLLRDIAEYRDQAASDIALSESGINNLLDAEKPTGTLNGWFQSLKKISHKSFQVFSKILSRAQNLRDVRFHEAAKKLSTLKKSYEAWAKSKGISPIEGLKMIMNDTRSGFLNIYRPEFYTEKEKAIREGNAKWIAENMDYDEERYEAQEARQVQFFSTFPFSADEKKNQEIAAKKVQEWKNFHKVISDGKLNPAALLNTNNEFLRAKDQWFTSRWVDMNKSENKPLREAYDYFQSLLRHSEKLGMLDRYSPHFIPGIHATKLDQIAFGDVGKIFSTSGIFESMQVDSSRHTNPEVDPRDNSIVPKIPVYFTSDLGEEKEDGTTDYSKRSQDLFKVFGIWAAHMYNYEAMESIEDAATVLLEAEKNKKSLTTDRWNNVTVKDGEVSTIDKNDRNSQLLEDFVNFYLYNRKSGTNADAKFKVFGTEYSALNTLSTAMRFFSLKTLALNPISGTAQFVGGTGNAIFQAEKGIFFTKRDWAQAMYLNGIDKTAKSAVEFLNVKLENSRFKDIDKLSLSSVNKIVNSNNAYFIQRFSDAQVQDPIAIAMMGNHMVENGEIVDITKFVKDKYNYNTDYYNLSKSQRQELKNKIEAEVTELKNTRNLLKIGKVTDGHFSIPGIDPEAETLGRFKDKIRGVIKKILGNSTQDDINHIRTTMFGMSLMQFRSWMPEMVYERWDGLKYNQELDSYTWGKFNTFFGELFSKRFPQLMKSIITGLGENGITLAKERYQSLRRDALENKQEFTISEGEFVDLYLANMRSELLEITTLLAFGGLIFGIASGGGDDDKKGIRKYLVRAMRNYQNEFTFYYLPTSFTQIVRAPIPVIGLAEDFTKFSVAMGKELAGAAFSQDMQDKAKPAKYFFRMVPIAKDGMLMMAAWDEDFRREWGIDILGYNK